MSSQGNEKQFAGTIKLDVRDSVADWAPYMPPKAPAGSPNILFVLFDDTGLAAWSPFGGAIQMPTLQKIANNGLMYTQWHTAALCSPTRSMLLTGRNHHLNGAASITEGANGFPGQHARIPDECATVAQILQQNGWSTFWVGKNHNVPETDLGSGSTRSQWPLAKGFDRFYGFIGGETNQWYPDIIEDNHPIELKEGHQPAYPEANEADGYHLSKDLADKAIQMIKDQKTSHPSKPWFMWFCPGANHAPHHAPESHIQQYWDADNWNGARPTEENGDWFNFRDGYVKYREWALKRMKAKGVFPSTQSPSLTNLNPLAGKKNQDGTAIDNPGDTVLAWPTDPDEQALYSKMMAVYAAFSQYTDEQIGRIYDYLEQTNQLENTVIIFAADNGASGEGGPSGSVNENKFFNGYPDDLTENMRYLGELGGPNTYEHFPTGWAMATSAPFKMFKRYSEYAGGTCDPLVISWPRGITTPGVRDQYHHANDIVPTILDICGLEMPTYFRGVRQFPISGVSMKYTFDAANATAETKKQRQYYAMLGTRAIWEEGYKAVSLHAPLSGVGNFDKDNWELYHVDSDRAEQNPLDLGDPANKRRLDNLIHTWFEEAGKNLVLPLDDRDAVEQLGVERPTEEEPRSVFEYYPGTAAVPESVAPNLRGTSFEILADVEVNQGCKGVIFAHGSRFGGHSLFINDSGEVCYVYNFLGIANERTTLKLSVPAGRQEIMVSFSLEQLVDDQRGNYAEGTFVLSATPVTSDSSTRTGAKRRVSRTVRTTTSISSDPGRKAQTGKFTLSGDGLCVGYDSADAVAAPDYTGSNPFHGGTIHVVRITPIKPVEGGTRTRMSKHLAAGIFAKD